jgi:hypothetical protein
VPQDIEPAGRGELRASDTDRDRVLSQLQDALATGMIDMDEFNDRSGQALQARTRRELATITSDLPAADTAAPAPAHDVVEVRGTSSPIKRDGRWIVPRKLVLRLQKSSAELDFTEAQFGHPVTDIELDISGSSVEIRLPEGASASIDDIEAIGSSVEDHRKNAPAAGRPHLVITGTVQRGSVELRGPKRFRKKSSLSRTARVLPPGPGGRQRAGPKRRRRKGSSSSGR